MPEENGSTSERKKDHIRLSLSDEVAFKNKSNGFDKYDFIHDAITEVDPSAINLSLEFLGKKIDYPFLISCMTGGTSSAENINLRLAEAAEELKIPVGMGSQRQALENTSFHSSYKVLREKARSVPVLGNIGAAQVVQLQPDKILFLAELVQADAMVIHLNPLQEMIQKDGEPLFTGLLKKIEALAGKLSIPVITKEVGAGISGIAAKRLLDAGVKGIDTAGAGGTSWSGVEMLRNNDMKDEYFWDWGLPASYCIKEIYKLKEIYNFTLIGSGGINDPSDMAKAYALGADLTASARIILQQLDKNGTEGVVTIIREWFDTLKKIMYLTGSSGLKEFRKDKIIRKEDLY